MTLHRPHNSLIALDEPTSGQETSHLLKKKHNCIVQNSSKGVQKCIKTFDFLAHVGIGKPMVLCKTTWGFLQAKDICKSEGQETKS